MMKFSLALLIGSAAASFNQDFYSGKNHHQHHQHSGYKSIQSNDGPMPYQSNSNPYAPIPKNHSSHHSSHHPSHASHHTSHHPTHDSHHTSHHSSHHPTHDSHHSGHHQSSYQPSHSSHHKASHYQPPKPPSHYQSHQPSHHQSHQPSHHQSHQPSHHQSHQPSHHQSHQPSHNQSHHHQTHHSPYHAKDPWQPAHSGHHQSGHHYHGYHHKPDGWYSATQQYSPPKIKFVPHAKAPSFAICKIMNAGFDGQLQIAQLPGKPSQINGVFDMIAADQLGTDIHWRINELGRLMTDTDSMCTEGATGKEWNPLTEKNHYGQANPYQDPTRGRIEKCTVEQVVVNGTPTGQTCKLGKADAPDGQKYLLQNVDKLVGRSITAYTLDAATNVETQLGCCIIGIDETPAYYLPKPYVHPSPYIPHRPHYGHGHSLPNHGQGHGHY